MSYESSSSRKLNKMSFRVTPYRYRRFNVRKSSMRCRSVEHTDAPHRNLENFRTHEYITLSWKKETKGKIINAL